MILWSLVGVIVGILMGLTGSGGAIISIPIFIHAGQYTLHQATVFALYCVLAGAALNFYFQRKNADWAISILLSLFSGPGSWAASLFKSSLPDYFLKGLFIAVCTFSLVRLWQKTSPSKNAPTALPQRSFLKTILLSSASGMGLGVLVTLTGLGGGVILVPLLMSFFHLSMSRATASSLMTVMISSIFSLAAQYARSIQSNAPLPSVDPSAIGLMMLGTFVAAVGIKKWIEQYPPHRLDRLRKFALTGVIAFSIGSLLFHSAH